MSPADLIALRARLGLTQAELARLIGLTTPLARRTVGRWELSDGEIPEHFALVLGLVRDVPEARDWLMERRACG